MKGKGNLKFKDFYKPDKGDGETTAIKKIRWWLVDIAKEDIINIETMKKHYRVWYWEHP